MVAIGFGNLLVGFGNYKKVTNPLCMVSKMVQSGCPFLPSPLFLGCETHDYNNYPNLCVLLFGVTQGYNI